MKTIVRFEFDNAAFWPKDFKGSRSVKLPDATHVPATGDKVDIRMDQFFDDAELLAGFEEQSDGEVYFAERMDTIIGKEDMEIVIVLYEEAVFKTLFPRFFQGEFSV